MAADNESPMDETALIKMAEGGGVFMANERQVAARQIAAALWEDPARRTTGALIKVTLQARGRGQAWVEHPEREGEGEVFHWPNGQLTLREWRQWETTPGFLEWWFDGLPEATEATRADLVRMEAAWWRSLGEGVERGDPKAVAIFAQVRHLTRKVGGDADEISQYLGDARDNGWLTTTAEA